MGGMCSMNGTDIKGIQNYGWKLSGEGMICVP
jgi:hypothetical protein